ncbi:MAG: hypothetical protein M0006_00320 [Magnetospirillum sp.]|nr:hypothetical protein [Magnetospirillum sp.]
MVWGKWMPALAAAVMALGVSACGTTPVGLTYDGAKVANAGAAKNMVEVASVVDHRKDGANWLGAIRGGFGNPLKTLETPVPVRDEVKTAFVDGLKARGLVGPDPRYAMELDIERFDCNQYVRREAHARIGVRVIDTASHQDVYQRDIRADKVTGSLVSLDVGVFASVDDLRTVANDVLQEAVDKTLDDPKFLALVK